MGNSARHSRWSVWIRDSDHCDRSSHDGRAVHDRAHQPPPSGRTIINVQVQQQTQWLTVDDLTASWHKTVQQNPEYQRGSKWRLEQQQLLIDSIFRGYPLPRFYFRMHQEKGVIGTHTETLEVIDGQQRIIAMAAYRSDHWPVP